MSDAINNESEECKVNFKGLHGWTGWGGSLSMVDPEKDIAFAYVIMSEPPFSRMGQA